MVVGNAFFTQVYFTNSSKKTFFLMFCQQNRCIQRRFGFKQHIQGYSIGSIVPEKMLQQTREAGLSFTKFNKSIPVMI